MANTSQSSKSKVSRDVVVGGSEFIDANHPPPSYKFPKRAFGKKVILFRCCRAEWFNTWSWLHYEEHTDVVLCVLCRRAVNEGKLMSGNTEATFVSTTIITVVVLYFLASGVRDTCIISY